MLPFLIICYLQIINNNMIENHRLKTRDNIKWYFVLQGLKYILKYFEHNSVGVHEKNNIYLYIYLHSIFTQLNF